MTFRNLKSSDRDFIRRENNRIIEQTNAAYYHSKEPLSPALYKEGLTLKQRFQEMVVTIERLPECEENDNVL